MINLADDNTLTNALIQFEADNGRSPVHPQELIHWLEDQGLEVGYEA